MWLAVHIVYLVGFKNRVTTVLHWTVSFIGRGRAERVLLETRLATGLPLDVLDAAGRSAVPALVADGLAGLADVSEPSRSLARPRSDKSSARATGDQRLVLTRRGRLLADAVVRALLP